MAQSKLFDMVSPDSSGVKFSNVIKDDKEINILEYLYFYNGAGVSIGDVNNDGLPDLYFTSNRYECKLYLNKGNLKFEDVTKKAGVGGYTGAIVTGVVMVDINNDGWMDMYLCRSASKDPENRRNILYVNNRDGTFTNRAKEYGIDDSVLILKDKKININKVKANSQEINELLKKIIDGRKRRRFKSRSKSRSKLKKEVPKDVIKFKND